MQAEGTVDILDAAEADLPQIVAIYNAEIERTTSVFSEQAVSLETQRAWLAERRAAGFPVLVARDGVEGVVAFASYGSFRGAAGYRTTVEHSVYVGEAHRRRGIGAALVRALLERARASGLHAVVAGIDADNAPSIAMHASLGFVEVARMPQVARKFGRWLDLVFMQLTL